MMNGTTGDRLAKLRKRLREIWLVGGYWGRKLMHS